jgi:hypothetical protein
LIGSNNDDAKEAGMKLQRLCVSRTGADYDIQKDGVGNQRKAIEAIQIADEIRSLIGKCRNSSVIAQMKTHVSQWRERYRT